jgi:hypothetical protein
MLIMSESSNWRKLILCMSFVEKIFLLNKFKEKKGLIKNVELQNIK